jgi:alpha-tubulin suppressor-like RCC1 family protein
MEELRNHRVRQVAADQYHCAALTEDGALFTWPTRYDAHVIGDPLPELGYGGYAHEFGVPHRVFPFEGLRIASVAVGDHFTVAVTETGAVYSFGQGDRRLGHADGYERGVFCPKRVEALDSFPVATVAAGKFHALALTRCGRVYSWGRHGYESPVHGMGDISEFEDVDDGARPRLITALLGKRVGAIAAGPESSCAVTDAGALYTWGRNDSGSLGHGDVRDRNSPELVAALHGIHVVRVSMYLRHTLALAADGSVHAFGEGPGLGIQVESAHSPQRIPDLVCMVTRR